MANIRDQFGFGTDVYLSTLITRHDMIEDYVQSHKLYPQKKKTKLEKTNCDGHKNKDPSSGSCVLKQRW